MISTIILTRNSEKYIKRCLDSLIFDLRNSNLDFEIFVVDNGSEDKTKEILDEYQKQGQINLIVLKENRGTTYPRNLAIKKASGEFILILDSDTETKSGTVKKLLSELQKNDKIGIVAPKLLYSDGSVQQSYKKFPTIQLKFLKSLPFDWAQRLASQLELYDFIMGEEKSYNVDYCISAFWLLRRQVIDKVGLLDEKIFYAPEDVDYCLRVWLGGYTVAYYPTAEVIHYTQRLSYKNKKVAASHLRGLLYFFKKHHYWFSRKNLYGRIYI